MALRTMTCDTDLMVYVSSVLDEPFEWGRTDCASIVVDALRAMYGRDVLKAGKWTTRTGAMRVLNRLGSYKDALARAGAKRVPIRFRQRGDVAILPGRDRDGLKGLGVVVRGGVLTVDELVRILPIEKKAIIMRLPNG